MEVLNLIHKWRRGCRLSRTNPLDCPACTERLINDIEQVESVRRFSGCITPKLYLIIDRLRTVAGQKDLVRGDLCSVRQDDLLALMNEFFRLDRELRRLRPNAFVDDHNE